MVEFEKIDDDSKESKIDNLKRSNISGHNKELEQRINKIIKNCFDNSCIEYSSMLLKSKNIHFSSPISMLKKKYKDIFIVLEDLIKSNYQVNENSDEVREEYYQSGKKFCEITYLKDQVVHKNVWDIDGSILENCKYDNGKRTGFKKIYSGSRLMYEGEIKAGEKYKGTEFRILLRDSKGFDLLREEAWINDQIEKQNDEGYLEYENELMNKEIEAGSQEWEEFCKARWEEGKRTLLTDKSHKEILLKY